MAKKILYLATRDIIWVDIPLNLERIGEYDVIIEDFPFHTIEYSQEGVDKGIILAKGNLADCIITCDFSRNIAEACNQLNIPYISWVYDCPHEVLYSEQTFYPTNQIYVFDRKQAERIRRIGVDNVYYMPLAIYPERIDAAIYDLDESDYDSDITFVGSLYYKNDNEKVLASLTEYGRKKWGEIVNKSFMKWDNNTSIYNTMSDDFVVFFDSFYDGMSTEDVPYIDKKFKFESYVLAPYLAHRERVKILNDLSEKHKVIFYTKDDKTDELSSNVVIRGRVSYENGELFRVYRKSRININITLRSIESGLSQRFFDVMASGGFLISNYQSEIEDYFEIGKDIIVYHNEEELMELADYYLEHDDKREEIARNGQRKVMNDHTYLNRFAEIIKNINW